MLKEKLKKSFVGDFWTYLHSLKSKYVQKFVIPPYTEKRKILNFYKEKYQLKTLVETGTFFGDTVEYFKAHFSKIISIELSKELADKAAKRFENDAHISIIQGDSSIVLKELVAGFKEPVLFWLDGHYSSEFYLNGEYIVTAKGEKETPIEKELEIILQAGPKHIVLIDDARLFVGKMDYPSMAALKKKIQMLRPGSLIDVKRDIIRITI